MGKMSDHELNEYCKEKQRQYDEHMKESQVFRDKMNIVEASLGWLTAKIDACRQADTAVKTSLVGIVLAILLQIGGFIYLWGHLNATVERHTEQINDLNNLFPRHIKVLDK